MHIDTRPASQERVSVRAGTITLALGVLFLAATVFTYVLSLTDLVNPPTWARIIGLVWLPIGLFGIPVTYSVARLGPGRVRGRVGLATAIVGLLAFVMLLFAVG